MTTLQGGEPTGLASVPQHGRGGCARVPETLLHGGFPDLGVLTWVWLRLAFGDCSNETSYLRMAEGLGFDHLSPHAAANKLSMAVQPLLGSWIIRTKLDSNAFTYKAVVAAPSDRYAMIRRGDLELVTLPTAKPAKAADIADLGRWQLECGQRGWTVEPLRRIAERWAVTHPTLAASRDRLVSLGLLKVVRRPGHRLSDLIWIRELYEAWGNRSGDVWLHPGDSKAGQKVAESQPTHPIRPGSRYAQHPEAPSVAALRQARADRRHRALIDLTALPRPGGHQRRSVRPQTHQVYLFHFPQEACFKVGITHAASHRITFFTNHSGILVDQVSVDNRALAELVEADVLALVEEWHRPGEPSRPGGGHTEMWAEAGPTVDLEIVKRQASKLVAQVRDAIARASSTGGKI